MDSIMRLGLYGAYVEMREPLFGLLLLLSCVVAACFIIFYVFGKRCATQIFAFHFLLFALIVLLDTHSSWLGIERRGLAVESGLLTSYLFNFVAPMYALLISCLARIVGGLIFWKYIGRSHPNLVFGGFWGINIFGIIIVLSNYSS